MKNLVYLLMGVALVAAIGACSDDSSDPASLTIVGESGDDVALNGTWSTPDGCSANTSDGSSSSGSEKISGSGISLTFDEYGSVTDCSGTSDITFAGSGSFTVGDTVMVALGTGTVTATKQDVTISTVTATPNTEDGVSALSEFCGVADGVVGTASSLVGTDCAPSEKDLLYVDDTVTPNRLYESSDNAALDADGYPTELSPDYSERQ